MNKTSLLAREHRLYHETETLYASKSMTNYVCKRCKYAFLLKKMIAIVANETCYECKVTAVHYRYSNRHLLPYVTCHQAIFVNCIFKHDIAGKPY